MLSLVLVQTIVLCCPFCLVAALAKSNVLEAVIAKMEVQHKKMLNDLETKYKNEAVRLEREMGDLMERIDRWLNREIKC